MKASYSRSNAISTENESFPCSLFKFPQDIFLISLGEGKYAANNATPPDLETLNGLACFESEEEASNYMDLGDAKGMRGEPVQVTFNHAREIAKGKMKLNCLLLFKNRKIIDFHYIK